MLLSGKPNMAEEASWCPRWYFSEDHLTFPLSQEITTEYTLCFFMPPDRRLSSSFLNFLESTCSFLACGEDRVTQAGIFFSLSLFRDDKNNLIHNYGCHVKAKEVYKCEKNRCVNQNEHPVQMFPAFLSYLSRLSLNERMHPDRFEIAFADAAPSRYKYDGWCTSAQFPTSSTPCTSEQCKLPCLSSHLIENVSWNLSCLNISHMLIRKP